MIRRIKGPPCETDIRQKVRTRMSTEDALKSLNEITEYFAMCSVNAAADSKAAERFTGYLVALDKARYAVRRLREIAGDGGGEAK